jgi:aldose 1-epimerase
MSVAMRHSPPASPDLITLAAGDLTLGIDPQLGGSLAWLRSKTLPLLRETPPAAVQARAGRMFAAYPLLPFAGRVRGGAFSWRGETYPLGRDIDDRRHAWHGETRFAAWDVAEQRGARLRLTLVHIPGEFTWPFAFEAWQDWTLTAKGLSLRLGLRNTHGAAVPAGLGWMLHLPRLPFTRLSFKAAHLWGCDQVGIPVVSIPDTGRFAKGRAQTLDETLLDGEYGGFGGSVEVQAPQRPGLRLSASKEFTHLSIAAAGQGFFSLAVATHRPDALNPNDDPLDEGMAVLKPGQTLEGSVELLRTE